MTVVLPTLRAVAESAGAVAARHAPGGDLSGVVILFAEGAWLPEQSRWQFQFQKLRKRLILGSVVATCWVEVCPEPFGVRLLSSGTFGPRQLKELAAVPGFEFPPPSIELAEVRFDVADVVRVLMRPGPLVAGSGTLALSIGMHDGTLAWRALQDVAGAGLRTLLLDTGNGSVLYDRTDLWKAQGPVGEP